MFLVSSMAKKKKTKYKSIDPKTPRRTLVFSKVGYLYLYLNGIQRSGDMLLILPFYTVFISS